MHQHVDAAVEERVALERDVEHLAHAAARAVGGDHPAGAHALATRERGGDRLRVRLEASQLGVEAQRRERLGLRVTPQDGLEVVLGAERRAHGADPLHVGAHPRGQAPLQLSSGQRLGPDDEPHPVLRQPGGAHVGFQVHELASDGGVPGPATACGSRRAALPEDLHRADVDAARLGMDGRAGMPLDQQRGHPQTREPDRRAQAHRPAADDEDGSLDHSIDVGVYAIDIRVRPRLLNKLHGALVQKWGLTP